MARNAPRRPPPRRPTRPGRPPGGRRPAPPLDEDTFDDGDDPLGGIELASDVTVPLTVQERTKQRDRFVVMVMTPAVVLLTFVSLLVASQMFYPDYEYVEPTPLPDARAKDDVDDAPAARVVLEPIDPLRLNAGVNERPPPFEWPEVDDLKLTVEPSRPNEQADYTPALAATELRRLIAVMSVNVTLHTNPAFAQGAGTELAKSYPLRRTEQRVIDAAAQLGYIPDDTGVGVVFTTGNYRVQLEVIAASPPIRPSQRAEIEYQALHLADHILRRVQETSGARRAGPEATAVHWRDHLARSLPFGR